MEQIELNPALAELAGLVGDWIMELSNAEFLPDRSTTLQGRTSFAWAEDGAILTMRQHADPPNTSRAVWLIGRDEFSPEYRVFYYDSRKVSRIYRMTWTAGTWTMWREAPGFWQRFECTIAGNGQSMRGHWKKSTDDGKNWQHDFDLTYRRPA